MTHSESMDFFYVSGGTLGPDAPSYVARQADKELLQGMLRGDFCYVLTSRQMGKSSLMGRTAKQLRDRGVHVVLMDLTAIGQNVVPEQWYDGLMARMGRQLRLEDELEQFWRQNQRFGPVQRLFDAIRQVVLVRKPGSLVIFIDEIDTVRSLPFSTDEFFAAIRECYNRRTEDAEFNRVTFCLLGVATPSDLIRETRITPFNIGRRVELHDFTSEEAAPLARGLQAGAGAGEAEAAALLRRVLYWTGGHPYLTQRLCQALAGLASHDPVSGLLPTAEQRRAAGSVNRWVDHVCAELFFSDRARERDDNLIFVRERLLRGGVDRAGLLHLYEEVQRGRRVRDDETDPLVSVLRLAGAVRLQNGRLVVRNRIYRRVFDRVWARANMPDAEVQRQRSAYLRGVIWASGIAAVVVAAMTFMVLIAVEQASRARKALAVSYVSEAQARRVSNLAGQRDESLHALRKARDSYPDKTALRDEVIACLALVDLKRTTNGAYPADQRRVAALAPDRGVWAWASEDGTITVRRLVDGQAWKPLPGVGGPVQRLCFGREETSLLAEYQATPSPKIIVWDWQAGQPRFQLEHDRPACAVDFSPQSGKLAVGLPEGRVIVYSLKDGSKLRELELKLASGLPRLPQAIRFDPAGERLAESCLYDQYVQIWDLRLPSHALPLRLFHADVVHDIAWHPRGERLATACADANLYLWDAAGTSAAVKLSAHEGPVIALAFSPQGHLLASLGDDETLRLWTPATGRQMALRLDAGSFSQLQFAQEGRRLIATGAGVRPGVWEVLGGEYRPLAARVGKADRLKTIDFSPDGRLLAAASGDYATLWEAGSGLEMETIHYTNNAESAWFSVDGRSLLASTTDGLFSFPLGNPASHPRFEPGAVKRFSPAGDELGAMSLSPDHRLAALVRRDDILLLEFEAGKAPALLTRRVGQHYHRLALHPQGSWVAAMVKNTETLHLWNLQADRWPVAPPTTLPSSEYFLFTSDGNWLITCRTGLFEFYQTGAWSTPRFSIPRTYASHQFAPIALSQDGALLALASSRYTIQLFRMPVANAPAPPPPIGTLTSPDRSPLELLVFSSDGRRLAAVTQNQVVHLWDLALLRARLTDMSLAEDWPAYP